MTPRSVLVFDSRILQPLEDLHRQGDECDETWVHHAGERARRRQPVPARPRLIDQIRSAATSRERIRGRHASRPERLVIIVSLRVKIAWTQIQVSGAWIIAIRPANSALQCWPMMADRIVPMPKTRYPIRRMAALPGRSGASPIRLAPRCIGSLAGTTPNWICLQPSH